MTDTIQLNDQKYIIRLLEEEDIEDILALFKACPDYFKLVGDLNVDQSTVENFLYALPPGKEDEDKFSIGIYLGSQLVGAIDLVKGFPESDVWMIGLVLLHPDYRGIGLGTALHEYIVEVAEMEEANKLRVGVLLENNDKIKYWEKLGYLEEKRTDDVVALELEL